MKEKVLNLLAENHMCESDLINIIYVTIENEQILVSDVFPELYSTPQPEFMECSPQR